MMRSAPALVAFLFVASSACAQEEAVRTIPFDGVEVFCHVLNHEKLTAVTSSHELKKSPRDSVLMLFGDLRRWPATDDLSQFVKAGGNLLVATDHGFFMPGIPVTFTGEPTPETKPNQAFRGDPRCPKLIDRTPLGQDHPIFRFVNQGIATNCPSRLIFRDPFFQPDHAIVPLMEYSKRATIGGNRKQGQAHRDHAIVGSAKETKAEGRALFIAGHGLFMNGMMMQSDNDNFAFALNVVRWLREGPSGTTRTKAMLIVDGRVITNFDVSLTPPPSVPVPPIKAIDRLLRGLENERFFHRILDRLIGENRDTLLSVLFAAVTFLLLLYGAKKLMEGRYLLETAAPRMVGATTALGPAAPAVKQRQSALFRQTNLGNEARLLARAWFRQEFGMEPEQWTPDARMEFQVQGWSWGRWSVRRQADRMLRLAASADVAPMTQHQFAGLLRVMPRLSAARRGGRLTLLAHGKPVRLGEPL
jgi:hypothetical protein